jgi:hypothetical protein
VLPKSKRARNKKAPIPVKGWTLQNPDELGYWFVVVVPPAAELVLAGGVLISPCSLQPINMVETAAIKNNSFFIS